MKSLVLGTKRLCFFGTEHAKGRKEGDLKEFWHLDSMCRNSKYASEYPENVEVKELPSFNVVGKAYQMLKTGVYVLRALALIRLDEFYFDNYAKDGNSNQDLFITLNYIRA
jgi:hypothetical protein